MIYTDVLFKYLQSMNESQTMNESVSLFESDMFTPVLWNKTNDGYRLYQLKGNPYSDIRYVDVIDNNVEQTSPWLKIEKKNINGDTRYGFIENNEFVDLSDLEFNENLDSFDLDKFTKQDHSNKHNDENSENKPTYSIWYAMREVGRKQEMNGGTPRTDVKMCIIVTPINFPNTQFIEFIKSIDHVDNVSITKHGGIIIDLIDIDERIILHKQPKYEANNESIPELMEQLQESTGVNVITVKKFTQTLKHLISDLWTREHMIKSGVLKEV